MTSTGEHALTAGTVSQGSPRFVGQGAGPGPRPNLVLRAGPPLQSEVPAPPERARRTLGGRSTVGHGALDAVIGVRIPASQPAFARLQRASAGSPRLARRRT